MRKSLNENPIVQVALIGVLAIVVGVLLISRMGSGSSEPPASSSSSAAAIPAASTETVPAQPASSAATSSEVAAASGEFTAGPGLPAKVVDAYERGETVVLLIVHREGIDDRRLEAHIDSAAGVGEAAILVVEAEDIADYSRIAEGVDVDRVPALVVIEPRSRAEGPLPEASVSYGYRGPESVAQAVRDALYKGRDDLPYHPQ